MTRHGERFTRLHILLYTLILAATSLVPYARGMSGVGAVARRTFAYSIVYLSALFAALLIDRYLPGSAAVLRQ